MFVGQRSGRRKKPEVKSTRGPSAEPGCMQLGRPVVGRGDLQVGVPVVAKTFF